MTRETICRYCRHDPECEECSLDAGCDCELAELEEELERDSAPPPVWPVFLILGLVAFLMGVAVPLYWSFR
jgi:hypothetical protein